MVEIPLLQDIAVILGCSVVVLSVFHRLGFPPIVGFLLTGILIGPHGLGLVRSEHDVETLAEIGVILLLFTIGLEFSLRDMLRARKAVLLGGGLQVGLTIGVTLLIALGFGWAVQPGLFAGFLIALSSTAIVLRSLQERAEVFAPHGRTILAILIFQDIIIVPLMILTPLLAETSAGLSWELTALVLKAVVVVAGVVVAARYVVPGLLHQVTRTRSKELFLLTVVLICIAVAWGTSRLGLSLGLGAFLAGLVISESEYSHEAMASALPFRDVFTSFFFVSVGMLLDPAVVAESPLAVVLGAAGVFVVKAALATAVALALRMSLRSALLVGFGLCQVGEFSFVLSKVGVEFGLIGGVLYQQFIAVSIVTMAGTPFIIALAPRLAQWLADEPLFRSFRRDALDGDESSGSFERLSDHLIIIGFGVNGRNIATAAKAAGIRFVIVDTNPDTVRAERRAGQPIEYGDATAETVLAVVGADRARVAVVAISDPSATRRILGLLRRMNERLHIIVRTRFVSEMKALQQMGADEVIPEEFETSVEIFSRMLNRYFVPLDEINALVSAVRSGGYEMFRQLSAGTTGLADLTRHVHGLEIRSLRIAPSAPIAGKNLAELDLRRLHHVTVLAVVRPDRTIGNPPADTQLLAEDILVVMGSPDHFEDFRWLIRQCESAGTSADSN